MPVVVEAVWLTVAGEPPVVEVVRITPVAAVVVAVAVMAEIVPVQTLPCGQQAMWPAASAEHMAVPLQQRLEPLFSQEQEVEPDGQLPDWRLRRSTWGSVALSMEKSEGEYGSSNGKKGLSGLRIEADMKAERRVMVRRMGFPMVEVGCDVRCESLVPQLAGLD